MASELLPPDFDLNLLRALDVLLTTRSVTASARTLGVGQPAMSKTLQRLRDHFGDPLLVRVGHDMVPTSLGTALAEPVRASLQAVQRVLSPPDAFIPATARGMITMAMPEYTHTSVAVPLIERLQHAAPGLDLRIRPLRASTAAQLVRGEVLLAIVPDLSRLPSLPKPDVSDFVLRPLFRDRHMVARAAAPPGQTHPPWTLESYASARHVMVTAAEENDSGFVDAVLRQHGHTRRVVVTVPGFLRAVRTVATTDLITTLPERFLRDTGYALDIQPAPCELPELSLLVAWHPRETANPQLQWLREQIAECVAQPTPSPTIQGPS